MTWANANSEIASEIGFCNVLSPLESESNYTKHFQKTL